MTRPNFAKLQILYGINKLTKEGIPANSVTLAKLTGKTVRHVSDDLGNLAKYHYVRRLPDNSNSCCFKYAFLKEGRSVLKKLTARALQSQDLRLIKLPFPVNFNREELDWINTNLKRTPRIPEQPAECCLTQSEKPQTPAQAPGQASQQPVKTAASDPYQRMKEIDAMLKRQK